MSAGYPRFRRGSNVTLVWSILGLQLQITVVRDGQGLPRKQWWES